MVDPRFEDLRKGVQIGPAGVVLDTLRQPRRARRVVDGDGVELGFEVDALGVRRASLDERLVVQAFDVVGAGGFVDHLDYGLDTLGLRKRLADDGRQLGIEDQRLRAGMIEDVADLARGEASVDRHDRRADVHRAEVRLEHRRDVGQESGDLVALADAGVLQRPCELLRTLVQLGVG